MLLVVGDELVEPVPVVVLLVVLPEGTDVVELAVPVAPTLPVPFTPVVLVAGVQGCAPAQLLVVPGVVDICPGGAIVLFGLLVVPVPFIVPVVLALPVPVVFTPVPG